MPDPELIVQLLALLPAPQASVLLALTAQDSVSPAQWATALQEVLEKIDWETQRDHLGVLLNHLLPLETLVPDIYAEWQPIVRDAVAFFGARLSPQRLAPKLVTQLLFPADLPLTQRLVPLLARMPTLQKLGQIVARNPYLAPTVRTELIRLENAIEDFPTAAGQTEIKRQLAPKLSAYHVEIDERYLAEASVSVVISFSWVNPATGQRDRGVFKVLKPYVPEFFAEELKLLHEFTEYLESQRHHSLVSWTHLPEVFEDIRRLLEQEINFPQEQANLRVAAERYARVAGVRIPRLIPVLSTPTITATHEEPGVKVTDVFMDAPWKRRAVARRLVSALITGPLFAMEENAMLHADPHAGNLFCNEKTGDIVLFDWALTERLSREQRRQLVLLMLGVTLRDEQLIVTAITALTSEDLSHDPTRAALVHNRVKHYLKHLPPFTILGMSHAIALLDHLALAGIRFPSSLVIFRKIIFTLEGVLHDVAPGMRLDSVLRWSLLPLLSTPPSLLCPVHTMWPLLSPTDWLAVYGSASWFGTRLWWQFAEQATDTARRVLELVSTHHAHPWEQKSVRDYQDPRERRLLTMPEHRLEASHLEG